MTRVSEPTFAAGRFIEVFDFHESNSWDGQDEHLCDAHTAFDAERLPA